MVDRLHQRGVGVILDWVPSHFPMDAHGLARFDGTHLYEHADPRQGYHPDWTSAIFNYGRREVRSFLISSALCWLDRYHADGLRVDAVASMLYLDYSRKRGRVDPQPPRRPRRTSRRSTSCGSSTTPSPRSSPTPPRSPRSRRRGRWSPGATDHGGLGFTFKWDMGWMHDTLQYIRREPVHRRFHHDEITFRSVYAFTERYVLPLSHDEVVHGKGSLIGKMPGDEWQRFANLRLLYGMMWAQPGKKLLFMGGELATSAEWNHDGDARLEPPRRAAPRRRAAVARRRSTSCTATSRRCARGDADPAGFQWIIGDDDTHSVFAWLRLDPTGEAPPVLAVVNATPDRAPRLPRRRARRAGAWAELLNSDAEVYGGSGMGNLGGVDAEDQPWHGFDHSLPVTLPPLAVVLLRPDRLTATATCSDTTRARWAGRSRRRTGRPSGGLVARRAARPRSSGP